MEGLIISSRRLAKVDAEEKSYSFVARVTVYPMTAAGSTFAPKDAGDLCNMLTR
jgi:hypothetical protein